MSGEFEPLSEEPFPFLFGTLLLLLPRPPAAAGAGDASLLLPLCGCTAMPWLCRREPLWWPWLVEAGPGTCAKNKQSFHTPP